MGGRSRAASGRQTSSSRHLKGKQVPLTLYLAPRQYWLLKSLSARTGFSMQFLLRQALFDVLARVNDLTDPRALPRDF
jgi:hypothetical protein